MVFSSALGQQATQLPQPALDSQELEEKTLADMDRYLQRMEQFEMEKNSSRAGGRLEPHSVLKVICASF